MQYDLVFEGGGAKGMVFVGAMMEFEERGHTIGRLLGTSAGAITAALLTAGYSAQEMLDVLGEKLEDGTSVFASFMGTPSGFDKETIENSVTRAFLRSVNLKFIPDMLEEKLDDGIVNFLATSERYCHLFSFIEHGGWFSADNFLTWMTARLNSGTFDGKPRNFGEMTLHEFYEATETDVSLVASDTSGGRIMVLNHRTAPDCPVVWAVRMSMNIPLLWQEVVWRDEWGKYREGDTTGHVLVDGGMLSNFPIELLVSDSPAVVGVMGPKTSDNVLGFLIDESLPVEGLEVKAAEAKKFDLGSLETVQRIKHILNTMMQAHDKMIIEAFADQVMHLPAQGVGTTDFDMSDEARVALVEAGQKAAGKYFDQAKAKEMGMFSFGIGDSAGPPNPQQTADKIAAGILG